MCVCARVCCAYTVLLWKALSLGFSIYIFINHRSHREGGTEGVFQMQTRSLSTLAHNMHRLAASHSSFTVYLPLYPSPNTHATCSSDCLPWRPDAGRLIFSSTRRLINTEPPHYSGLTKKQLRQASQTCYNPSNFLFLQSCLNSQTIIYPSLSLFLFLLGSDKLV